MLYTVKKHATGLEPGETYSPEELAKKGDVPNMIRKGIVEASGFISAGQPMSDSEAARTIADLQQKLEAAEDERDAKQAEIKELKTRVKALEAGHAEGSKQLAEANRKVEELASELARKAAK